MVDRWGYYYACASKFCAILDLVRDWSHCEIESRVLRCLNTTFIDLLKHQAVAGQLSAHQLLTNPNVFKTFFFTPSREILIILKYFLTTFSHTIQDRPGFRLALRGWLKGTVLGNLSFIIHKICPNHQVLFNHSRRNWVGPNFSTAYSSKFCQ